MWSMCRIDIALYVTEYLQRPRVDSPALARGLRGEPTRVPPDQLRKPALCVPAGTLTRPDDTEPPRI